jgi:SAM-dependent methyltransferase
VLQRYVTGSLPRSATVLSEVVATAEQHLAAVGRHTRRPLAELRFFEFGAGWDLATPLAMAALGVRQQLLFDIVRVATPSLIDRAYNDLRSMGLELPEVAPRHSIADLLDSLGITYVAPTDARRSGLPEHSIDVAVTTSVLEHVSEEDIREILVELRRVLAPGGICSFAIDYHDHYAASDPGIDGVNFLRFSDDDWRKWNCSLQYQNRLRHGDYVELFQSAGFELVEVHAIEDPALPTSPTLDQRFLGRDDLTIGDGWFVLRPLE